MQDTFKVKFSSKVKIFRNESYDLERKNIKSIKVGIFLDKDFLCYVLFSLDGLADGQVVFNKTGIDHDSYYSFAQIKVDGIIQAPIPKESRSKIIESASLTKPKKLIFKALRLMCKLKNADQDEGLLLNESGGWAKIDVTFQNA